MVRCFSRRGSGADILRVASRLLRSLGFLIADLAFPRNCGSCLRPLSAGAALDLCEECVSELPFMSLPYCDTCGTGLKEGEIRRTRCGRCRRRKPAFNPARGAFRYEGVIRKAIHKLKFSGRRELARTMGDLAVKGLNESGIFEQVDCLVPVPLHPQRAAERGYDQTLLLARRISEIRSLPIRADILQRVKATRPQVGMDAKSRALNVRDAFCVRQGREPRGLRVLLIDDVITTGATMDAAARALLEAGAKEVRAASLARD